MTILGRSLKMSCSTSPTGTHARDQLPETSGMNIGIFKQTYTVINLQRKRPEGLGCFVVMCARSNTGLLEVE
eukprot:2881868-Amphidinium_carterae.1